MATDTFKVRRLDDKAIYDIFTDAKSAAQAASKRDGLDGPSVDVTATFFGISTLGQLDLEERPPQAGMYTIKRAYLKLKVPVKDVRNNNGATIDFTLNRGAENELDSLTINQGGTTSGDDPWRSGRAREAVVVAFDQINKAIAPTDADPATNIGQLSNFAENIDRSFRGFTEGVDKALNTLEEQRAASLGEIDDERKRLKADMESEREKMLSEASNRIEKEDERLSEREAMLAQREAELDIKSHKDARRKIFSNLQDELQSAIYAPRQGGMVVFTRIAVFFTLLIAGLFAGYLAFNSMSPADLGDNATGIQIWIVILKPVGLTIVAFGAFAAAVQWLRHFYTRDLRVSEEFQRFRHDMARASWIIEATLEMEKEHQTKVPEKWLSNVTDGLFRGARGADTSDEAQQALAALLGFSTCVKAGQNGLEVNLGRRGTRRISNAFDDDET